MENELETLSLHARISSGVSVHPLDAHVYIAQVYCISQSWIELESYQFVVPKRVTSIPANMPILTVATNVPKSSIPNDLSSQLSGEVARLLSKPESYVAVHIVPDQDIAFGSSFSL